MAGFVNAAGPAVDEAGLYNNWNGRVPVGGAQVARRAAGQEIIDYVRYAFKQGKNAGNACGALIGSTPLLPCACCLLLAVARSVLHTHVC
jgi:hypothetical protein